jgi:signal transduction histidine kinase
MAGVVFQLETAKLMAERDPGRARPLLDQIGAELQEIVADVRRLVHQLRPPALDDRGLLGALGQLAESLPVPVTLSDDDPGALPAAVEVAAYRIVAESLTNVVRHAHADTARVTLARSADGLVVEVADDGVGIAEEVQAGVGLLSVRERAAELGGQAEVCCPEGGGTVVRAVLPVPREKSARDDEVVGR